MLGKCAKPSDGNIFIFDDTCIGYVPQVIEEHCCLSGGERFNVLLTEALAAGPNLLLLDEPTNHLDAHNRTSLMRMLSSYRGTLIVVSHDVELLRNTVDILWHIDNMQVHVFSGNYDDYMRQTAAKRTALIDERSMLNRQKKMAHDVLMREQKTCGQKQKARRKKPCAGTLGAYCCRRKGTSGRRNLRAQYPRYFRKKNVNLQNVLPR